MDVDGKLLLIVRFLCVFYDSKGLKYNSGVLTTMTGKVVFLSGVFKRRF